MSVFYYSPNKLISYLFKNTQRIRVNCWYCNTDAILDLSLGESAKYWICQRCESENFRDEQGQVMDPIVPSKCTEPPKITTYRPYIPDPNKPTLCNECQKAQALILYLSEGFIPDDENEFDYKERCQQYLSHKRYLDDRYDLCQECHDEVAAYLEQQTQQFGPARLYEPNEDAIPSPEPQDTFMVKECNRNRSMTKFKLQRLFWISMHAFTLLYLYYITCYPAAITDHNPFSISIKGYIAHAYHAYKETNTWNECIWLFINYIRSIIPRYYNFHRALFVCSLGERFHEGDCTRIDIPNGGTEFFLYHLASYYGVTWHVFLYTAFWETHRYHYWKLYSFAQHVLFLFRTSLFFYPPTYILHKPTYCIAVYLAVLFIPFFIIRIRKGYEYFFTPVNVRRYPSNEPYNLLQRQVSLDTSDLKIRRRRKTDQVKEKESVFDDKPKRTDMDMLRLNMRFNYLRIDERKERKEVRFNDLF
ncbi:hypothetical protein RMATCC62417_03575 [Rhizopus microsporus]|nr:hypothetical protein RMATCC62417_03575 [Rhizopus microsporus]